MSETHAPRLDAKTASVWDLDGTLLTTDVFGESLTRLLLGRPWMIPQVLVWFAAGRSSCKGHVAAATLDSWSRWPVRPEAERLIAEARRNRMEPELVLAVIHTESGFYNFARDFNGTCVAHGARGDFVGLPLWGLEKVGLNKNCGADF